MEGLKFLFIPDSDNINEKINSVKDKFSFIEGVKLTISDLMEIVYNNNNAPVFTIEVGENKYFSGKVNVIDFTWYAPYKEFGDIIICCFCYAFFFWRIFIRLPDIISGAGGDLSIEDDRIEVKGFRR